MMISFYGDFLIKPDGTHTEIVYPDGTHLGYEGVLAECVGGFLISAFDEGGIERIAKYNIAEQSLEFVVPEAEWPYSLNRGKVCGRPDLAAIATYGGVYFVDRSDLSYSYKETYTDLPYDTHEVVMSENLIANPWDDLRNLQTGELVFERQPGETTLFIDEENTRIVTGFTDHSGGSYDIRVRDYSKLPEESYLYSMNMHDYQDAYYFVEGWVSDDGSKVFVVPYDYEHTYIERCDIATGECVRVQIPGISYGNISDRPVAIARDGSGISFRYEDYDTSDLFQAVWINSELNTWAPVAGVSLILTDSEPVKQTFWTQFTNTQERDLY